MKSAIRPLLAALLLAIAPRAVAAQESATGWFHVVWGVHQDTHEQVRVRYLLTDDGGATRSLDIPDEVIRPLGGPLALDRRRVAVEGARAPLADGSGALPTLRVRSIRPEATRRATAAETQGGSKAYVTILCLFADSASVEPHPAAFYQQLLTGAAAPGLDHYWREQSDGRIDLGGSVVVGWYALPQPYAYYNPAGPNGNPNWSRMTADCTGAADADVDFSKFRGVNMQFNGYMGASWGGSWGVPRDGVIGLMPATWMASWAEQSVYGHEMGHSLGLPHSSGPYTQTYDSRWDMMSYSYVRQLPVWGYVAQHTMIWHKDLLGWVPAARKYVPAPGSRRSFILERTANPVAGASMLEVQMPIAAAPGQFYTVEARQFQGYDVGVPGQAVVLHRVDPTRVDRAAQVVDTDNNGNPNDAGAMWTPGETFVDAAEGFAVRVDSATASGFGVTVSRGWELRVEVAGAGTVTGNGTFGAACEASCARPLAGPGTSYTLTATPQAGGTFLGWSGACAGVGSCTVSVNSIVDVRASFGGPITISSDSTRPAATMGAAYADTVRASGGTGAVTWALAGGTLPPGVAIDAATGALTGIPTAAGVFRFTLSASAGGAATRAFIVVVGKPTLQPAQVMEQLLGGSGLNADQLRFLDLLGNRNGRLDVGDVRAWLLDDRRINLDAAPGLRQILESAPPTQRASGTASERIQ